MPDYLTSSYSLGNYNIVTEINHDISDIKYIARHKETRNNVFIGSINQSCNKVKSDSDLLHKITCAFVNGNCKVNEFDEFRLFITLNLYDNTILKVDLYPLFESC